MMNRFQLAAALWLAVMALPAAAQQEIRAPFGLQWGETPERLERVLKGAQATVVERRDLRGRQMWTVEGIVQPGLKRTVFYFENGVLNEVELQYQRNEWDDAQQLAWVEQIRRTAESKYGPGAVFLDETEDDDGITRVSKGYQWVQDYATLRLVYFTAAKGEQKYRTVSLHYRGI